MGNTLGSCLGIGRPVSPGANPRLLGSNLVNLDVNHFGIPQPKGPHGANRSGQILRAPNGAATAASNRNGVKPNSYLINGKGLPTKLFRQSSSLSGGQQGAFNGGPNVVTKLVDIDDNPLDRSIGANNANSQLICNSSASKQQNKALSSSSSSNNQSNSILSNGASSDMSQTSNAFMQSIRMNPSEVVELVALYNYDVRTKEDLAFVKGEHLETTLALMQGEWWLARSKSTKKIGYVPQNYVGVLKSKAQLNCEPWYFGKIGRHQAEMRLKSSGNENGAFIIRDSDTFMSHYSLSLLHDNAVKHYRIKQFDQGGFYIDKNTVFSTIHDLVEEYSSAPKGLVVKLGKPCKPWLDKPATVGLSYDTCDAWEIDRKMLTIGQELGRGQFGQVFEGVFNNQGKHLRVAIKTLRKDSMEPQDFLAEAQIMKKMRHENLIQLYAVCTREEPVYIITELMSKGALINYLQTDTGKSLPFAECVNMATQIANGMKYIEKEKYVHRDLAARNILVGEHNVCKIADFGLARFIKETEYEARAGARFPIKWTAPEAANFSKFTIKSDVWSFGIVLYEIITKGGTPYPDMSNAEVLNSIDRGYRMAKPADCEPKYYEIMMKCWNKDPNNRPTFEALHWKLNEYFHSDEQYRDASEFRLKRDQM